MPNKILFVTALTAIYAGGYIHANTFDFNAEAKRLAIQSSRYSAVVKTAESDLLELKSENSLAPLEAEFGYLWGEGETGNKWNLSISQSFDWPGVYSARSKSIKATERVLKEASRGALLSQMLEIKQAMIDIVAAGKNMAVSQMLNDTINKLYDVASKGVEQGEVTRLDLNKIAIERISVARQLNADKRAYAAAVSSLESICGSDAGEIIGGLNEFPDEHILAEEHYERLMNEANPTLSEKRANILAAKATATTEQRLNYPGFNLGYSYENEGAERWHGVTAGISIPLFTSKGKAKAAKLRVAAAESEAIQTMISEVAALKAERAQAVSLYDEVTKYETALNGTDNIALLQKALAGGQMSVLDYLQELTYFISARRDYIDLRYQYALALARLNRLAMLD
ncbi:MAG: TolC family protein [Paramuribaculum sp.]|nr:TolC family protein [Paramuribaculum sp.]